MPIGDKLGLLENAPKRFADLIFSMGQRIRYFRSYRCACKDKDYQEDYEGCSSDGSQKTCPKCRGNGRIYDPYEDYNKMGVSSVTNEKMRDRIGQVEIGDVVLTIPYYTWDKSSVPWQHVANNMWETIGEGDKIVLLDVKRRVEDIVQRERDYRTRHIFIESILDVRNYDKVLTENLHFTLVDNNKINFNDNPIKGKRLKLDLDVSKELKKVGGGYIRDKYDQPDKLTMIDSASQEFELLFKEDYNTDAIFHNEFVGYADTGQMAVGTVTLWGSVTTKTNQTITLNGQFSFYLDTPSKSTEKYSVQYLIQPTYIVYRDVGMNRKLDNQLLPKRVALKKKDFIDP
ncbi:hypothetical protein KAR91_56775 [Candidatus Pacearchaeota archaeon]|nr:hypothetical protein [Candidatus Pacearchaeota archaeon]